MISGKSKIAKQAAIASGVLAAAVLLGWTAWSAQSIRGRGAALKGDTSRKPAPDFALKDIDGHTVHLSDYRGKVVVLDFWATWCGPCKVEIPWFTQFENNKRDQGFAVLGVAEDEEGWQVVKPFLKDFNVNYRVVIGDDKTNDQYGGIEALPTTFLIDRNGRVAAKNEGLTPRKDFEDAIDQLLRDGTTKVSSGGALPAAACCVSSRATSARAEVGNRGSATAHD